MCGDVEGRFEILFQRITSIQKKAGVFDVRNILNTHIIKDSIYALIKVVDVILPLKGN